MNTDTNNLTSTQHTLLEFVADHDRSITAPEAAEALSLPRTTARENLQELAENDLIDTTKSGRTRLFHTPSTPWGDHQLLTDKDREFLQTGPHTRAEQREALNRILTGLRDYPREIPLTDGPKKEDVAVIAEYTDIDTPIEEVTYMELTGSIMQEIPNQTKWEEFKQKLQDPDASDIRSVRLRLNITQAELGEHLADKFKNKTAETYAGYISQFENGEETPLTDTALQAITNCLETECESIMKPTSN